jgi:hypothetical protein
LTYRERRSVLNSKNDINKDVPVIGNLIFPGAYVAYEIVERLFKSNKSFNLFMCISKEEDIESRNGSISLLSIPIQEMRQHRNTVCEELFGCSNIRSLTTSQRIKLAKALRSRYNSSIKQIARLCGLVYDEIKAMV